MRARAVCSTRYYQHPEAQHDTLTAAGCEQIFIDHASGKLARRPEFVVVRSPAGIHTSILAHRPERKAASWTTR